MRYKGLQWYFDKIQLLVTRQTRACLERGKPSNTNSSPSVRLSTVELNSFLQVQTIKCHRAWSPRYLSHWSTLASIHPVLLIHGSIQVDTIRSMKRLTSIPIPVIDRHHAWIGVMTWTRDDQTRPGGRYLARRVVFCWNSVFESGSSWVVDIDFLLKVNNEDFI